MSPSSSDCDVVAGKSEYVQDIDVAPGFVWSPRGPVVSTTSASLPRDGREFGHGSVYRSVFKYGSDRRVQPYRPNAYFVIIGLTGAGGGAAGGESENVTEAFQLSGRFSAANSQ
jgi:hypothetical protein